MKSITFQEVTNAMEKTKQGEEVGVQGERGGIALLSRMVGPGPKHTDMKEVSHWMSGKSIPGGEEPVQRP